VEVDDGSLRRQPLSTVVIYILKSVSLTFCLAKGVAYVGRWTNGSGWVAGGGQVACWRRPNEQASQNRAERFWCREILACLIEWTKWTLVIAWPWATAQQMSFHVSVWLLASQIHLPYFLKVFIKSHITQQVSQPITAVPVIKSRPSPHILRMTLLFVF